MNRHEAREQAFCIIFESEFLQDYPIDEIYANALALRELKDNPYMHKLVYGAVEKAEELSELIDKYSVGWKAKRISRVSRTILLLSLYEMKEMTDTPIVVSINEAVELAKKYDADEARGFVNGILNSAARNEFSERFEAEKNRPRAEK